jgi:hypothetical protein
MNHRELLGYIITIILVLLIIFKIIFLFIISGNIFFKYYKKDLIELEKFNKKVSHLKQMLETILLIVVSLLLIFIFDPWYKNQTYITKNVSTIFYFFGFILLFNANWSILFN